MATLTLNAQRLRELGHDRHLCTDKKIAEALGVAPSYFSNVAQGHRPPNHRFIAACLSTFPAQFDDVFVVTADEPTQSTAA